MRRARGEAGAARLLSLALGGASEAPFSAAARLHAASDEGDGGAAARKAAEARTRGMHGGVRSEDDADVMIGALLLLRQCFEGDAAAADEAWADEPLGDALVSCVDGVGTSPVPPVLVGGTRSMFAGRREAFTGKHPLAARGAVLMGWSAELGRQIQRRALEALTAMCHAMFEQRIPIASAISHKRAKMGDAAAMREVHAEERRRAQHRVASRVAASAASAACRLLAATPPTEKTPDALLVQTLNLLEPLAASSPVALAGVAGRRDELLDALCDFSLSINASDACRAGRLASATAHQLRPGSVEGACLCLMVVRSLAASDPASAARLCGGGGGGGGSQALAYILRSIRAPLLRGGGDRHDARLLLHCLDVLATVSTDAAAPTWPLVAATVLDEGGVEALLELLPIAPPTVLPLVITVLADWMRDPPLRAAFRAWGAPPGFLLPAPGEGAEARAAAAAAAAAVGVPTAPMRCARCSARGAPRRRTRTRHRSCAPRRSGRRTPSPLASSTPCRRRSRRPRGARRRPTARPASLRASPRA